MNLSRGILLVFFGVAFSAEIPDLLSYKEGQRFFIAPDKDGKLQIVDVFQEEPINRYNPETDMIFRLYTRNNPRIPEEIIFQDLESLVNSSFDVNKDTKIFTHGWNNHGNSGSCTRPRDRYLEIFDVNIICADWSAGSNSLYATSVLNVPPTGQMIGRFVDWLVSQGSSVSSFHISGFSLGGHVAGVAGRSVTSGVIPYITSFDPAGPLWGPNSQRIRPSDAAYVEVIHTNTVYLGLEDPVGHNDFYPNGGKTMPGCGVLDFNCSHARSYQYFTHSIDHTGFMANQCADLAEISNGECSNLSQLHMGGASPKEARGIFWLETSESSPYYLG